MRLPIALLVLCAPALSQTQTFHFPYYGHYQGSAIHPRLDVLGWDESAAAALGQVGHITKFTWNLHLDFSMEASFLNTYSVPTEWVYGENYNVVWEWGWLSQPESIGIGQSTGVLQPGESHNFSLLVQEDFDGQIEYPLGGWSPIYRFPTVNSYESGPDGGWRYIFWNPSGAPGFGYASPQPPTFAPGAGAITLQGTLSVDWIPRINTTEICAGDGAQIELLGDWINGVTVWGGEGFQNEFAMLFRAPNYHFFPGTSFCIAGPGGQRINESLRHGGIEFELDLSTVTAGQAFCLQAVHRVPGGGVAFSNAVRANPN